MAALTEARAVAALADPARWPTGAATLLSDLGFTLIDSDRPGAPSGSHLLVGFRAEPTLRHFDPESISFWEPGADHPRRATFARSELRVGERPALWGHVHLVDRLGVENRFLSFGGRLRIAETDPAETIVDLTSPGPIVRWGGHSQSTDVLAEEIGAFFGRLIVPVDFVPGAEARIAATSPEALYGSFLADSGARRRRLAGRSEQADPLGGWIAAEARRVETEHPDWLADGRSLLSDIGSLGAQPPNR